MPNMVSIVRKVQDSLSALGTSKRGNVAIIFGLSVIPVAGLAGAALDYNRAIEFRTFMHSEGDSSALAIASADAPNADGVITSMKQRLTNHYGAESNLVSDISATGTWVGGADYTLTVSAKLKMYLVSVVPGAPSQLPISVTTTVRRTPAKYDWTLPTIKDLSNEAWDYNRLSVYCYNESKKNETNQGRRLETLTAIADNYGTNYSSATLPVCGEGETLSYKLWNVRNGKEPGKTANLKWWQKNSSGQDPETYKNSGGVLSARSGSTEYYSFFTDTVIDPSTRVITNRVSGGKEDNKGVIATLSEVTNSPIMESVVCTTNVDCKPQSEGGVLPNLGVKNKTPQVSTTSCAENKSIYYGWEDRPPSAGGSDKDFDDIRIVVSCPKMIKVADKEIRIIR